MNSTLPTLDTPTIHPTYIRLLCQILSNQGIDPKPILETTGLGTLNFISQSTASVSVRAVNQFIDAALEASDKPWLGLTVGMLAHISTHGSLGYAVIASPNMREALVVVARYIGLRNAAIQFRLRETEQGATLELIERVEFGHTREFVISMIFASLLRFIEAVLGCIPPSIAADLPFLKPTWHNQIEQLFAGRLRFGGSRLNIHFDQAVLASRCSTADALAFEQSNLECERLLCAVQRPDTAQRVREILMAKDSKYPTLLQVAQFLNISTRTLTRRLNDEGTRFQTLLDADRQTKAEYYLINTNLSMEEIASRLDYEDTSNFSRSFRRWRGQMPSELRANRSFSKSL
jgi:AraC-like DNA-binding protein